MECADRYESLVELDNPIRAEEHDDPREQCGTQSNELGALAHPGRQVGCEDRDEDNVVDSQDDLEDGQR